MSEVGKREGPVARGHRMLHESGSKMGGGVSMPKAKRVVRRAVREHENDLHDGKHSQIKRRSGGKVPGEAPEERPDRRARGGSVKSHGKPKVIVNVNAAKGDEAGQAQMAHQAGLQQGMQLGARAAAAKMAGGGPGGPPMGPPHPPPAMAPGPGGPPGMMPPPSAGAAMPPHPMPPPGMAGPMQRGGHVMRRRDEHGRFAGGAV